MRFLTFVFMSAVRYDHCLSGRTRRMADALAAVGHRVYFVEMPSLKASAYRLASLRRAESVVGNPGVVRVFPFPAFLRLHSTGVGRYWVRRVQRRLLSQIPDMGDAVVVVSTPWWAPILRGLPHRLLCYDYIDHLSVHSTASVMGTWDGELLSQCDLVTTVSETLERSIRQRVDHSRVALIPNGVESTWLDSPPPALPRSGITGGKGGPIAGFIGALFEWIDLSLLVAVAEELPEMTFALAGPTRAGVDVSCLRRVRNIRLFPAQRYCDVPRWIGAFDVCLIPFKNDVVSHSADPIKLYEYLALGKPVVSSLPFGVTSDPAPMLVGETAARFADCVRRSLQDTDSQAVRKAFARRHTWEQRAAHLLAVVKNGVPALAVSS